MAVTIEMVLIAAQTTIDRSVIAQSRASVFYALGQHRDDGLLEPASG